MRVPHVLVPATDESLHHLCRVLRLRDEAELSLTDGAGGHATGRLTATGSSVAILEGEWNHTPRPAALELCAGISKGAKLDLVVEKATEIGVTRIVPVMCRRSERRWTESEREGRVERWRRVAAAALEQSRGLWLPEVADVVDFDEFVGRPPIEGPCSGLIFVPGAARAEFDSAGARRLLVGPEGGFDPTELDAAGRAGWRQAGLGDNILRAETAAIAVVALKKFCS